MDWDKVRQGVVLMLQGLDINLADQNFRDTPDRIVRTYQEIFDGLDQADERIDGILAATFPCEHEQMIVIRNVEVFSVCPHHFLPVHYNVTVAYMPGADRSGRVVGISKPVRLVELMARRPVLQEQMVDDIAEALMSIPGCSGSACVAEGEHHCMRMRGVRQSSASVIASSMKGVFITDHAIRSEFMSLR